MRTLADRLSGIRRPAPGPAAPREARASALASWFGARLTADGTAGTVVVERSVTLPADAAALLATAAPACYFDTETTGLSTGAGTVIFLAALGSVEHDRFVARQYLLPDHPHEPALLRAVTGQLASFPRMVTYNGRSFDLPLLAARLTLNGLFAEMATLPQEHDDLLPLARRLWRRPLGGARLADVESGVLGVRRTSDCPGSEVPERYFAYLRGGSPDLLAAILDHNLQDIVSLALMEAELLRLRSGGWRTAAVLDRRGMALDLLRAGASDDALALLEDAIAGCHEPSEAVALRRLATRLLLTAGEVERAEMLWRRSTRFASLDAVASWIEVARIRERHRGDLRGALEAAEAASRVLDLAFALGRGGGMLSIGKARLAVDARRRRLRRWIAAADRREERQRLRGECVPSVA
jgi:uncharacterized protein YprB with RNaseH-like and TPR domain